MSEDSAPLNIKITYNSTDNIGLLTADTRGANSIWDRLTQAAILSGNSISIQSETMELPWPSVLNIIREFSSQQRRLNFRFRPEGEAKIRIVDFVEQFKRIQSTKNTLTFSLTIPEISQRLALAGFKRTLRSFQLRDLQTLLALQNGANFSVPGAGKTTVALALSILVHQAGQHLMVIGPKASFPAWREVIDECIAENAPNNNNEQFTLLSGSAENIQNLLESGATRFLINYDLIIQIPDVIRAYLARNKVHLILDESHRMKAGARSQRGSLLLNLSPLPVRKDILTGTPMPQDASDLQSQLDFLWPGIGLGAEINGGRSPRDVLGKLYVRTTKEELQLPKPKRKFIQVDMAQGQMALYSIVKSEALRDFSTLNTSKGLNLIGAKRSVMRLLQLSSNPTLALRAIANDVVGLQSGIVDQVFSEGPSTKMRAVADLARSLAKENRKSVIWTIFTDTIIQMESLLADLNPVTLYGAVPTGDVINPDTREGRIFRFHQDPACQVLIANPAAAGEGISLHHAAHDAIYIDRSYVTTHYLQSIDRIHRLGLPPNIDTNIFIFQTKAPGGLGCIDHSVSRRLAIKLRALQILLDDPDLHQVALDEEEAEEPIDYGIDQQDIIDLIEQLEGRAIFDEDTAE